MEKQKVLISIITGALATFARQYAAIIVCVAVVVVLDFITGMVASIVQGIPINSKVASRGFWKKIALFLALLFGFFLDWFVPCILGYVNIDLPIEALFGMIFGCYIVINESISIAENLYKSNPEILPVWVIRLLTGVKNQIDQMDKEEDDGKE